MNKSDITESSMDTLPGFLSKVHYLMSERHLDASNNH